MNEAIISPFSGQRWENRSALLRAKYLQYRNTVAHWNGYTTRWETRPYALPASEALREARNLIASVLGKGAL